MKWFKFYGTEYLSDPKMLSLSPCMRSCWVTLLSYASINDNEDDNGIVKHLTETKLMLQAGIDPLGDEWEKTVGVLERFKTLEMIQIDNEVIMIVNWQKRQENNLTGYERVKRYRQKKRNDNANDNNRREEKRREEIRIDNTATATPSPSLKIKKDPNEPQTLKEFLTLCESSPQRHIQIIGGWAEAIKPDFSTYGQWQKFLKRNLRAANDLKPFTDQQIIEGMKKLRVAEGEGWLKKFTLETLLKFVV